MRTRTTRLRAPGCVLPACVAAAALLTAPLPAQSVPARTLAAPLDELDEPFSTVGSLRELSDGRVVVLDTKERQVFLVSADLSDLSPIGRQGGGPGEYRFPLSLHATGGDTTLVYDPAGARFVVIEPAGKPVDVLTLAELQGAAPIGPTTVRGFDRRGRVYFQAGNMSVVGTGVEFADSAAVVRFDPTSHRTDTVTWIRVPAPRMSVSGDLANGGSMKVGVVAFPGMDGWFATRDGHVVVIRVDGYRVERFSDMLKRVVSTSVPYERIRVTEADKEERREASRRSLEIMKQGAAFGADGRPAPRIELDEPEEWPDFKPPFTGGEIVSSPDGTAWIGRLRAAGEERRMYDVIDASGRLLRHLILPASSRLVGVGTKFLYVVRSDEDDLQYLQRYAR